MRHMLGSSCVGVILGSMIRSEGFVENPPPSHLMVARNDRLLLVANMIIGYSEGISQKKEPRGSTTCHWLGPKSSML